MIIVNVFQVGTVLFEQDQIRVVAYQMFRYSHIRLTEIETIDIRMASHRKVFSHCILFVACTSSKIKIEFERASLSGTTSLLLENVK